MPLYTRTGDHGTTGTLAGRVSKDGLQVAAMGALDALHAYLAVVFEEGLRTPHLAPRLSNTLQSGLPLVMHDLLDLGTHVSALELPPSTYWGTFTERTMVLRNPKYLFTAKYMPVDVMEDAIDAMEESTPTLRSFILHTGSPLTAYVHVARTSARAAEVAVVAYLNQAEEVAGHDQVLLTYLNRLSDYLFALARLCTHAQDGLETVHQT